MKAPLTALALLACAAGFAAEGRPVRILFSGDLTREHALRPGEKAEGRLVLQNPGSAPASVRIYQTDYGFSADGSARYDAPGTLARSNAGWIEIDDRQPELSPGEARGIPYRVSVPDDPGLNGTYWSMVMIEPVEDARPAAPGTIVIRSVTRYGVQIVVQVGATAAARPRFSRQQVTVENGRRVLSFDLANEGGRWLRPRLELRLFDGKGRPVSSIPCPGHRIFPGMSVHEAFDLQALLPGDYLAYIVLESEEELYGAQVRFRID